MTLRSSKADALDGRGPTSHVRARLHQNFRQQSQDQRGPQKQNPNHPPPGGTYKGRRRKNNISYQLEANGSRTKGLQCGHSPLPTSQQDSQESQSKTASAKRPAKAGNSSAPKVAKVAVDEAVVTRPSPRPPTKHERPPPLFIHNKERWSELRTQCTAKNIAISNARNSVKGLKIQPASTTDFWNLSALFATLKVAYHTISLKEEREIRVVLRGIPKEIPTSEIKEDLLLQNLPVNSVRRMSNRNRDLLDLVLVISNYTEMTNATKKAFFDIKTVCSLTGIKVELPHKKRIPGQCFNFQMYGHSSKHCFQKPRCVKCLGDHGTTACTRNNDTDGPPACVLCKSSGHTANYLACPRAPKKKPFPQKIANPPPTHPPRPHRAEHPHAQ